MKQGFTTLNANGRFEFDGFEVTSGDVFEVRVAVGAEEAIWTRCRAEFDHDLNSYYFVTSCMTFVPVHVFCREIET